MRVSVYVGLCLRRRRRCKAPNDLGPRATCGWIGGRGDRGMSGRTSWRVGGFYAYTYTFFICWHFAIYFIFVLLETAAWQRQQQQHQLCPVTSFSLRNAPFRPRCLFVPLAVCLSARRFVCLFVCCCSVNAAGNGQRLVLLFSGLHFEKSFGGFASKRPRPVRVF